MFPYILKKKNDYSHLKITFVSDYSIVFISTSILIQYVTLNCHLSQPFISEIYSMSFLTFLFLNFQSIQDYTDLNLRLHFDNSDVPMYLETGIPRRKRERDRNTDCGN